ncbi:DNA polymerase III subunit gamma/tau [Phormidium tenue FACHB-886]|nr:DNA polymerase III subunit gamma/tau [Phormidium tenue FACHB-886]
MAYEPLHHKYRPQTFAELVGQAAIATTLTNALRQQRIAPAYLFTGARGTGKTSSARILAKSLNCLNSDVPTEQPCGICEACRSIANGSALDVIEIDAASNTGVDNIRELIERSQFAPVQCRYKVYVVDECHMLSTAAFNALLKTLEEPPDRVVFVLATTDPQRVLPTIISRCQRFDFRRIPLEAMVAHLSKIAQQESIAIAPEAIQLIAQISQGGLRDAESLLDQLSLLEGQITVERVWDLVGAVPERDLLTLLQAIAASDATTVIEQTRRLMDRGREPLTVLQNLASFYRDLLIAKTAPDRLDLVALTPPTWKDLCQFAETLEIQTILTGQQRLRESEVQVKNSTQPRLWLEVTLTGLLPSAIGLDMVYPVPTRNGKARSPQPTPSSPTPPQPSQPPTAVAPASPPSPISPPSSPPSSISPPSPPPTAPQPSFEAEADDPAPVDEDVQAPQQEPAAESPAAAARADAAALQQIWDNILNRLQRLTHALFRQQGCLLAFDGAQARVGISSQPLFGMAKQQLPSVEAAFEQLYGHKIRVSIEVTNLPSPAATAEADAAPPPQAGTVAAMPNASNASKDRPIVKEPNAPHSPRTGAESSSAQADRPAYAAPSNPPPLTALPSPSNVSLPVVEEDLVSRAAKSVAQMFNGQIIDLEEETPIDPALPSLNTSPTDHVAQLEGDSEDSEEDVPF